MSLPEERQAQALKEIAHHNKELVRVMSTLNENLVKMFEYMKKEIEKDSELLPSPWEDSAQMTIDQLRANAERAEEVARQDRERRRRYEETLRSSPIDEVDPIQDKVNKAEYERSAKATEGIDIGANQYKHTSEFNNPHHRPTTIHFEEGVE